MNYVTHIPEHTDAEDCIVPAAFQFILSNRDFKLLISMVQSHGGLIAAFWQELEAFTCDSDGQETEVIELELFDSSHFLCNIPVESFRGLGLTPSYFNDHIGETRLIPIVYEMVHYYATE